MDVSLLTSQAKDAALRLAAAPTSLKNAALMHMAEALEANIPLILRENGRDLENARQNQMSEAMLDRLALSEARIRDMADGVRQVARLADPVGEVVGGERRPNGLNIRKVRVPFGVIAIIYEARPNVTADSAALCLKSGNAVILRGGKEAFRSNNAIAGILSAAVCEAGLPEACIQMVSDTSRETANALMRANGGIDLLIPRGGAGLIRACVENATVPVIQTGTGICHIYVDESADEAMAEDIVFNAKTSRPSVCNACECLLVHRGIAESFLPRMKRRLDEKQVELRCCPSSAAILGGARAATDADYDTEFLDYILAVKVVDSVEDAISHINRHGTGHSECIVTHSLDNARLFQLTVDAAAVYVNASTRFTDGGEFGLGAEIGISTQKMHARGPMGLRELTSCKYLIDGDGHVR
ncbi:MAG: glutamate-5-semialdehyde dehydrogenase [Clostridia bacterium]|nr:glutamate-5-semialdehyde dehydrogenase [Clostridia bacterium]